MGDRPNRRERRKTTSARAPRAVIGSGSQAAADDAWIGSLTRAEAADLIDLMVDMFEEEAADGAAGDSDSLDLDAATEVALMHGLRVHREERPGGCSYHVLWVDPRHVDLGNPMADRAEALRFAAYALRRLALRPEVPGGAGRADGRSDTD